MSNNESKTNILSIAGIIYLVISQIMMLYFWYDWTQGHGFLSSCFIGPIVAELKGLLWIFFIW
jgi:hypothetical protein